MAEISENESFALALDQFVMLLAGIVGELEESKPKGIDLPSEYRWQIEPLPMYMLQSSACPFTEAERAAVAAFAAAISEVPQDAGRLTAPQWRNARKIGVPLLCQMEALQRRIAKDDRGGA